MASRLPHILSMVPRITGSSPKSPAACSHGRGRGRTQKSIYYKGSGKGNPKGFFFSKGHYVSGIRSYMAMNNGFETGMRRMRDVMS